MTNISQNIRDLLQGGFDPELGDAMTEAGASAHDMLWQAFCLVQSAMKTDEFLGDENGDDTATFLDMNKGHEAWAQAREALEALDKAATYSAPKDSYLARNGLGR